MGSINIILFGESK